MGSLEWVHLLVLLVALVVVVGVVAAVFAVFFRGTSNLLDRVGRRRR